MIFNWFKNLSIRNKLLWLIIITSSFALLVDGIAIIAYDSYTYKKQRIDELVVQAEILGNINIATITFGDVKSAQEYLSALRARRDVVSAVLYDNYGKIFTYYVRDEQVKIPTSLPTTIDKHIVDGNNLIIFKRIISGNEAIGTLYILVDMGLYQRLLSYAGIVLILIIGSAVISLIFSAKVQTLVSKPILDVVYVAERVIANKDYSYRVKKVGDDEIGILVDSFNEMLQQIEQHEASLQASNLTLQKEIEEHKKAKGEIDALNRTLEKKVADRTIELEASNKELESFSYSVSHDLRAPLRSIDGFTMVLQQSYADKFDDKGKDYMERIRAATQRMAHLIDDLLKLSRISRAEMAISKVDLSEMAFAIAKDLKETNSKRVVNFNIMHDMPVNVDPILIRIVLENLMGNAWKFTGRHPEANIDVGYKTEKGEKIYYVKDDGAGFDMKYVDKLFGVFQRLHAARDFEGTGVGLANVARVIKRHGGKVWAEGEVEKGATFYFTLGKKEEA